MDSNGPLTRSRNKRAHTRAENSLSDTNEQAQETFTFASSKRTRQVSILLCLLNKELKIN